MNKRLPKSRKVKVCRESMKTWDLEKVPRGESDLSGIRSRRLAGQQGLSKQN